MPTTVVNKYKDKYDIYIGRGSKWDNPYSHKDGTKALYKVKTREEAIEKYQEYFYNNPQLMNDAMKELNNKILGCFCKPLACHGDILATFINSFDRGELDELV